jgi:hypothetical protein
VHSPERSPDILVASDITHFAPWLEGGELFTSASDRLKFRKMIILPLTKERFNDEVTNFYASIAVYL